MTMQSKGVIHKAPQKAKGNHAKAAKNKAKGIGHATKKSSHKKGSGKKKKGGGGFHMSSKSKSFHGRGIRKTAAKRVDADLRVLLKGLGLDMNAVRRERDYQVGQANDLLTRSKGDLEYLRGEVADTMGANNAKIDQTFNDTKSKTQALQQALRGEMQQSTDANKQAAMAELQRLGIQQTGTGRFDADANFAKQLAEQSGANNQANLEASQAMSADIGQMLLSMNEGQYQSNVGNAININAKSVSDLSHSAAEQLHDISDEATKARAGRGSAINELYQQMYDSRFSQWATTRDMNFNQRLAALQFNQSEAQRKRENAMAAAAARRAARGGGGGGGGGGGTSYSSSGSGSNRYHTAPPPAPKKRRNPLDVLVPKKKRKLKNTVQSGYTPSGKFIDIR